MYCPSCGHQNAEGTKFCESCGKPMSAATSAPRAPHKVEQSHGGVYIGGSVTGSSVAGRDMIQQFYSTLPVPDFIKNNANDVTAIYAGICELLAILATFGDVRNWQMREFPPMLTPAEWQSHLPLPSFIEIVGMFLKNNILFFGLGALVAAGIIAALWYMRKKKDTESKA